LCTTNQSFGHSMIYSCYINNFNFNNLQTLNYATNIQIRKVNVRKFIALCEHLNTISCWYQKTYNIPPKRFSFWSFNLLLHYSNTTFCTLQPPLPSYLLIIFKPKDPYLSPMCRLQMNVLSVNGNTKDPSVTLQETWSLNINCNILDVKTNLVRYELGYNICEDQVNWMLWVWVLARPYTKLVF
jgi:hypothetical protein